MSSTPQVTEVDCSTGLSVTRDLTQMELEAMQTAATKAAEEAAAQEAAAEAKAAAKASASEKLAKLGLTADEIAAMLG
jgi:hypothetical protein